MSVEWSEVGSCGMFSDVIVSELWTFVVRASLRVIVVVVVLLLLLLLL